MAGSRLRRFVRYILRLMRKLRDELRMFRRSAFEVLAYMLDRGIKIVQLKYDCLRVRKRI